MCERVPLTNVIAARMIASALSGCGGNHSILGGGRVSAPTATAANEGLTVNAHAALAAGSATEVKVALLAKDRSCQHHSVRWLLSVV